MKNELIFQKAKTEDLPEIAAMFENAVEAMKGDGIDQWDEIYPSRDILAEDIARDEMYVGKAMGKAAAAFVLNRECDEEYKNGDWADRTAPFLVVHRLCVSPDFQNRGIGSGAMRFIEKLSKRQGIRSIRLDAFSLNPAALKIYENLGFCKVGEAHWRKGLFFLYEKTI